MSGPEHQVAEIAAKVAKEKYGLDVNSLNSMTTHYQMKLYLKVI